MSIERSHQALGHLSFFTTYMCYLLLGTSMTTASSIVRERRKRLVDQEHAELIRAIAWYEDD